MKPLISEIVGGRTFHPVYVVNDWGCEAYFIGTDYKCSAFGTHSISGQTDLKIEGPFECDILYPDGKVARVKVVNTGTKNCIVSDHGNTSTVVNTTYGIKVLVHGISMVIDVQDVKIDLTRIRGL